VHTHTVLQNTRITRVREAAEFTVHCKKGLDRHLAFGKYETLPKEKRSTAYSECVTQQIVSTYPQQWVCG